MEDRAQKQAAGHPSTRITLLRKVKDTADHASWRQFVDQYTPLVFGYCRQRGLQDADARDVTQNVFVAVARAMGGFEYDRAKGRFRSWLGTIAVREIGRAMQRWNRPGQDSGGEASSSLAHLHRDFETAWEAHYNGYLYSLALKRIRPSFDDGVWEAFDLTWNEHRKPADVAMELRREPQWVYAARFRVLRRLRAELEELAEDHPLLVRG